MVGGGETTKFWIFVKFQAAYLSNLTNTNRMAIRDSWAGRTEKGGLKEDAHSLGKLNKGYSSFMGRNEADNQKVAPTNR
jgi:hypothetical protein